MADPTNERLELIARRLCQGLGVDPDARVFDQNYIPYRLPYGLGNLYPSSVSKAAWEGMFPLARAVDTMFPEQEPA